MKKTTGYARRLKIDDNVNTDYVISGRYKFAISDPRELAKHIFEDLELNYYARIKEGDFIVAGDNFGCGSSREQAPQALIAAGIKAIIAKSFARIFYRNAFNLGLCLIECDTDKISDGDQLELDVAGGTLKNLSAKTEIKFRPLHPVMRKLLSDGGVIEHFKKHGGFSFGT